MSDDGIHIWYKANAPRVVYLPKREGGYPEDGRSKTMWRGMDASPVEFIEADVFQIEVENSAAVQVELILRGREDLMRPIRFVHDDWESWAEAHAKPPVPETPRNEPVKRSSYSPGHLGGPQHYDYYYKKKD